MPLCKISGTAEELNMSFEEKLDVVLARHEELEALLGSGDNVDGETFVKLSKELAGLKEIVAAIHDYKKSCRIWPARRLY